ncbi:peroxisomal biogenesis factor 2 [Amblyomma americanum]
MSAEKPVVGSRVSQLDAVELDDELFTLFKNKLTEVFKYAGGNFYPTFEPEVKALLKAVLYGFTVYECGATVGQRLLGLGYFTNGTSLGHITRQQTLALILLGVGLPWLRERGLRLFLQLAPPQQRNKVERGISLTETAIRVASVINFVLFLVRGRYCSLGNRIVGVVSGHAARPMLREVQFDFMNRELLWHGFAEFIGFLLPVINMYPAKNFVSRKLLRRKLRPTEPSQRTPRDMAQCGICGASPTQPHEIGCKHVFCYYCIASQVTADANYSCPRCNCPSHGLENVRKAALPLNLG